MPTIQYGGNPSAWADRGRAEHDNEYPTTVTATATVTNSGNALGRARIRIGDITRGQEGIGDIKADSGWYDIDDEGENRSRPISTSFNLDRDAYLQLAIDVIDDAGNELASTSTSVNTYDVPRVANLTSGGITINVR
jgi:hypothetical protein